MKHYTRVLARVDLDAVEYNIEMMKKNIQKDTQMMAVIKMDGYGHGAVQISWAVKSMYILSLTLEWQDWDSRLQRRMPKKSQRSVNCRTW